MLQNAACWLTTEHFYYYNLNRLDTAFLVSTGYRITLETIKTIKMENFMWKIELTVPHCKTRRNYCHYSPAAATDGNEMLWKEIIT